MAATRTTTATQLQAHGKVQASLTPGQCSTACPWYIYAINDQVLSLTTVSRNCDVFSSGVTYPNTQVWYDLVAYAPAADLAKPYTRDCGCTEPATCTRNQPCASSQCESPVCTPSCGTWGTCYPGNQCVCRPGYNATIPTSTSSLRCQPEVDCRLSTTCAQCDSADLASRASGADGCDWCGSGQFRVCFPRGGIAYASNTYPQVCSTTGGTVFTMGNQSCPASEPANCQTTYTSLGRSACTCGHSPTGGVNCGWCEAGAASQCINDPGYGSLICSQIPNTAGYFSYFCPAPSAAPVPPAAAPVQAPAPAPPQNGACCLSGACFQTNMASCTAGGGSYNGDGSTMCSGCTAPPTAGCCLAGGGCIDGILQTNCNSPNTWLTAGVSCSSGSCPSATVGACCVGGTCYSAVDAARFFRSKILVALFSLGPTKVMARPAVLVVARYHCLRLLQRLHPQSPLAASRPLVDLVNFALRQSVPI